MSGERIGLIGLGLMGTAFAANLLAEGFDVLGHDRAADRCEALTARGGRAVSDLSEFGSVDVVVLSLPHGAVVREVCLGPGGLIERVRSGATVIDTSTGRPEEARGTAAGLAAAGIDFLDVTVSGTSEMAHRGDLVAMVGGPLAAYERVRGVLAAFTRVQHHLGPVGSGSQAKLVVNLVVGVSRAVLGEAFVLAERSGLDLDAVRAVLADSVAGGRVLDVYGERLAAGRHGDPTGRLGTHAKTIDLILESGREVGAPLWFTEVARKLLRIAEADGMSDLDSTATVAVLRRLAGPADGAR